MAAIPDDQTLTEKGFDAAPDTGADTRPDMAPEAERLLVIACGALAREIIAVRDSSGLSHIDLTCLPAILHNHPDQITGAVEDAVLKHKDSYARIFVAYADCGTGGQLRAACDRLGVQMIDGPHCYAFYEGLTQFPERDDATSFYLTDFLVRQFDAFVWKPLGLDRYPELRDMYFGNYRSLVYQAQTDDPELDVRARICADRLGLRYERRLTGYGDLGTALRDWAVVRSLKTV